MVSKEREIAISKTINGHLLNLSSNGLWVNSEGDSGYHTRLTGAWVCYVCGHLCECGEKESEQTLCGDCLRSDCIHLEEARA